MTVGRSLPTVSILWFYDPVTREKRSGLAVLSFWGELRCLLFVPVSVVAVNVLHCTGTEEDLLRRGPGGLEAEEGEFHSVFCPSSIGCVCS